VEKPVKCTDPIENSNSIMAGCATLYGRAELSDGNLDRGALTAASNKEKI
jgi:hypothetical protein